MLFYDNTRLNKSKKNYDIEKNQTQTRYVLFEIIKKTDN